MGTGRIGRRLAVFTLMVALAACSGGPDTFDRMQEPPEPVDAELPPVTSIAAAGGQTIRATRAADWTLVAYHVAWVSGLGNGIGRFEATTGRELPPVGIPEGPCAAADAGAHRVWTLTCEKPGVAAIDPSGEVSGWLSIPELATNGGESSIGFGEDAVWALADHPQGEFCSACVLLRIDPERLAIVERYDIPPFASAVRAGEGGVWVVYQNDDAVLRIDPETGKNGSAIKVGSGPLFFDVGEGGVWVMNQADGSVSHIDPATDTVVATIDVDASIQGGDLTVGEGSVWLRASDELVAQIDPATDRVVARFGEPAGSGSASAGDGMLWISAHDVSEIYRVPIEPF